MAEGKKKKSFDVFLISTGSRSGINTFFFTGLDAIVCFDQYSLKEEEECLHVYVAYSSSPPAAALDAARFFATRPGAPWPYGEFVEKSMCFSEDVLTLKEGTFTSWFPTRICLCRISTRAW